MEYRHTPVPIVSEWILYLDQVPGPVWVSEDDSVLIVQVYALRYVQHQLQAWCLRLIFASVGWALQLICVTWVSFVFLLRSSNPPNSSKPQHSNPSLNVCAFGCLILQVRGSQWSTALQLFASVPASWADSIWAVGVSWSFPMSTSARCRNGASVAVTCLCFRPTKKSKKMSVFGCPRCYLLAAGRCNYKEL